MIKSFQIGEKKYKFKKEAISHYRSILNSYDFGKSLNDSDFNDLIALLDYYYFNSLLESQTAEENSTDGVEKLENNKFDENDIFIEDIKVSKVQFNTKCFEIIYSDKTSQYISYLMLINRKKYTPEKLFYVACRNSVHQDIKSVKQEYFDNNSSKGLVKCQETSILSNWTELVVDHRQPNTFSIIVDRFKEVNIIDINTIEYTSNNQNHIIFKDETLSEQFRKYHKEKANLRIVRAECNSSRVRMARLKRSSKDLVVK